MLTKKMAAMINKKYGRIPQRTAADKRRQVRFL